uniref:NADH dehydrogenase subunit 4 n=1 Tax=Lepidochelys olivacea TaxID=27788 RepID=B6GV44_LEPOA|nr:NADH dehydrogenase subunit 4 [Lepidochelys olivacea]
MLWSHTPNNYITTNNHTMWTKTTMTFHINPQPNNCHSKLTMIWTFHKTNHKLFQWLYKNKPNLSSTTNPIMLTYPYNNLGQPKPLSPKTIFTKTNLYFNYHLTTNLTNTSLLNHKTNYILYHIWNHTYPNTSNHHTMKWPNKTTKCKNLLPILYPHWISPTTNRPLIPMHRKRFLINMYNTTKSTHYTKLMNLYNMMICTTNSLYNQNTTMRLTFMMTKSTCKSPNCKLNNPSRSITKTKKMWYYPHYNNTKPLIKNTLLPFHGTRIMKGNHNWFYLLTTNKSKIINRLLISKPHKTNHRRNTNTNPMSLHRRNYTYNRPWLNVINTLLPSQHKLRTNSQPNTTTSPKYTTPTPPNKSMMTTCQLNWHSPPTNHWPNKKINYHYFTIQLIQHYNSNNKIKNPNYRYLHSMHIIYNTMKKNTLMHKNYPPNPHTKTSPHIITHPTNNSTNNKTKTNLKSLL